MLLELCEEEPLDPWTERARRLRSTWATEQQAALARALRYAPNDAAAIVMVQVSLGMATRGAKPNDVAKSVYVVVGNE